MGRGDNTSTNSSYNALGLMPKRHRRWYERILLNSLIGYLLTFSAILWLPTYLAYGAWTPADDNQLATEAILVGSLLVTVLLTRSVRQYPDGRFLGYRLSATILVIGLTMIVILALRLDYSRLGLFIGLFLLLASQIAAYAIGRRFRYVKFAMVPCGTIHEPEDCPRHAHFFQLDDTNNTRRFDALVVDMESELSDEWVRFIARHNARNIPVLNSKAVQESLTGRVDLDQLNLHDVLSLQPSAGYLLGKRVVDTLVILAFLPLLIPLMLVIAIMVRLESPGPALFIQARVGAGNRPFRLFKFRSMTARKADDNTPRFADEDQHRITALGKFLRRSRLDELPQLVNVLLGHMSLIGPRPEQPSFAESFEDQVPYYSYRHIVKPGITGWAQVQQGYASGVVDTHKKVEHDFYYIKQLGFGLDALIVMKTIRTILTGFGAR